MTEPATPPRPSPKHKAVKVSSTQRAQQTANDVGNRIMAGVDANPVAVLAGGIAAGLVAGALLPKSTREAALLGPLGARLNEGAVAAVRAARTAGTTELAAAGLSRVNASDQVGKLLEVAIRALGSAGTAARAAAVDPATAPEPALKARGKTKG